MLEGNTVTQEDVDEFYNEGRVEIYKMNDNTTVVTWVSHDDWNMGGWTIVESSSCVDPSNYDHELGVSICEKKIKDKLWELLGFLLYMFRRGDIYLRL